MLDYQACLSLVRMMCNAKRQLPRQQILADILCDLVAIAEPERCILRDILTGSKVQDLQRGVARLLQTCRSLEEAGLLLNTARWQQFAQSNGLAGQPGWTPADIAQRGAGTYVGS